VDSFWLQLPLNLDPSRSNSEAEDHKQGSCSTFPDLWENPGLHLILQILNSRSGVGICGLVKSLSGQSRFGDLAFAGLPRVVIDISNNIQPLRIFKLPSTCCHGHLTKSESSKASQVISYSTPLIRT
jgi:hypothetical protein